MRAFWEGGGYWMQKEGNARVKNLERVFIVFFLKLNRFGSVQFGFLGFRFIKPKPNRTEYFFKNSNRFNRFFFSVRFFRLIFSRFSRFIRFSGFFAHP